LKPFEHLQDCSNSYTRLYNLTHHRIKSHPDKVPAHERQLFERREMQRKMQNAAVASSANLRTKPVTFNTQQQYLNQLAASAAQRARFRKPIVVRQFVRPAATSVQQSHAATINGVKVNVSPQTSPSTHFVRRILSDGTTSGKISVTMVPRTSVVKMVQSSPSPSSPTTGVSSGATATAHIFTKPLVPPSSWRPNGSFVASAKVTLHHCPMCPFSTCDTVGLRQHRRRHGGKLAGELRCAFCDYVAVSGPLLQMHSAVHFDQSSVPIAAGVIDELPLRPSVSCVCCGRRFASAQELFDHEQLHMI
jgi:hypothetical protein